jgi:hypothetical protein
MADAPGSVADLASSVPGPESCTAENYVQGLQISHAMVLASCKRWVVNIKKREQANRNNMVSES